MEFKGMITIGYSDIFEDFDTVSFEQLIKDIPSINIIKLMSFLLSELHSRERDPLIQIDFLNKWGERLPEDVKASIFTIVKRTRKTPNNNVNFINNISGLTFIQRILTNFNYLDEVDDITPQQELNLFKAYLFCSQEWINEQLINMPEVDKVKGVDNLIKMFLLMQMPYHEIQEFKDFKIQFLKSLYFFKFCENNETFKNYLNIFLNEYKLKNWQEYMSNISKIYIRKFDSKRNSWSMVVKEDFKELQNFLSQFCVDIENFETKLDFMSLRNTPILKTEGDEYIQLNLNFLIDKIYQGIQFDFAKVLVKNKATYNSKLIKNTIQFNSIYGDVFTESGLFYKVMEYAFGKSATKRMTGIEMKNIITAEPDYYIRDKSKIFLFEYKNVLLSARVKNSHNADHIIEEVLKKWVKNENGAPKGVSQIVNSINNLLDGGFDKLDMIDTKNCTIYPILIFEDHCMNTPGINHILNLEFRKIILEKNLPLQHKIKDIVALDLNTLVQYQELFRNSKFKLSSCITEYMNLKSNSQSESDKLLPFKNFLHKKANKIKYEGSEIFYKEFEKLLLD
jgi:hypothetical protein